MSYQKILTVEDETLVGHDTEECLERLGYTVLPSVSTGEEAVQVAELGTADAILMDIRLRGEMDGIEAAGIIQSRFHIPVVLLSAFADDDSLKRAKSVAPAGIVVKPYGERELFAVLEMALSKADLEARLRESEKRFTAVLSAVDDSICLFDRELNVVFANEKSKSLFGDEVETSRCYTVLHNRTDPCEYCPVQEAFRDGESHEIEAEFTLADGSRRDQWCTANVASWDDDGRPSLVVKISRDITERKQAEEASKRFRAIADQANYGSAIADLDGNIVYVNQSFARMHGYEASSLIGRHLSIFHSEDQMPRVNELNEQLVSEGEYNAEEVWHRSKDGTSFPTIMNATVVTDEAGRAQYLSASAIDIGERRRTDEALRESEERFRTVLESLPGGVFAHDLDGRLLLVNEAACRNTGYSREELLTMSVADLDPASVTRDDRRHLWNRLSVGDSATIESNHARKDGTTYPAEIHLDAVILDGQPIILALAFDITERRQAEETLRLHSLTLNQIEDRVTVTDLDGVITYINDVQCETLGRPREELIGQHVSVYGEDPASGATQEEIIHNTIQDGGWRGEVTNFSADGSAVYLDCRTQVVRDDRGDAIALCGIATDITERRRMEEALKESDERLKLALDSVSDAVWDWRVNTGEVYFSSRWYTMLGYEPYELPQSYETWKDLLHPEDVAVAEETVSRHLESTEPFEMEIRMRTRESGWRWVLARGRTVEKDQRGNAVRMLGTHVDITDRKRTESERERLLAAIEQAAEAIVITDPEGTIQYVNPVFESVSGHSREEAMGQTPRILKSGRHDGAFYREMWETITSGSIWRGRVINKKKDGTLFTEEATISPVRDTAGKTVNYVAVKRDVTHELELESQLRQAQKMEAIGTLAGGIAHDFNNILSALMGYTDLAIQDAQEEPLILESLTEIANAANRATELVKQILAFSRQVEQQRVPLRLQSVLKEVRKLLRGSLPSTIEIREVVRAECRAVMADPSQMHQVIMNLCTNAYQAMEEMESGLLRIGLSEMDIEAPVAAATGEINPGPYVRLSISDTGVGMDEEMQKRIFEPYFTTKEVGAGTGLGLATVHGIVKSHGGEIGVESVLGEGSTFHVYVPVCPSSERDDAANTQSGTAPRGHERILLVDDEQMILDTGKRSLERLGYRVETCSNGEEALRVFHADPTGFDAMITDLTMPKMTGTTLAKEVLKTGSEIPIILCTGFTEKIDIAMAKSEGFADLLRKPVEARDLASALRRVLDRAQPQEDRANRETEEGIEGPSSH